MILRFLETYIVNLITEVFYIPENPSSALAYQAQTQRSLGMMHLQ